MKLTRRQFGRTGLAGLATGFGGPWLAGPAAAEDGRQYGMSLVGPPKYGPDYKQFGWVNAAAPKGGRVRMAAPGGFDSFNPFPAEGVPAVGMEQLCYDRLYIQSPDEAGAGYPLVAEYMSHPPDRSSATFHLRDGARFHDGTPITPEDVLFSMETLKRISPLYNKYYLNVVKWEKVGPADVKFTFDVTDNAELPQIVSELYILPKHWWEGKTKNGAARDPARTTLEVPLTSGPYRVKSFEPNRSFILERVKDWWAADLPIGRGQYNFDEIEFTYFKDRTATFEAFKAGVYDFRREATAKNWAQDYTFDAITKGFVKKETIPIRRVALMGGFVMNTRRQVFKDVRVRRAMLHAFDFDWTNKNLQFGLYRHLFSYFDDSELASSGLPQGLELEILNTVKADLPPEVFTTDYRATMDYTHDQFQTRGLRVAAKLLAEAGYTNKNGVLTNAQGQPLAFEFLLDDPSLERIVLPYKDTLTRLGVRMSVRNVDDAQYQQRVIEFDYDMILGTYPQSESPGNEQREFFGSAAASHHGSHNLAGVADKAIDVLIERIIFNKGREDLVAATRALDRTLLWNFYMVPGWYVSGEWVAYWDRFGRPATLAERSEAFLQTWWIDPDKDKALAAGRGR